MFYPVNAEGLVRDESEPSEPQGAIQDVDAAGLEEAPTLSADAVDALDQMAERQSAANENDDQP